MKKLLFILAIIFSATVSAQDFNGVWADSSSASFTNATAVFSIQNDSVFMTHYVEFNGNPFVEHGEGIVKGKQLIYTVKVTVQVPGWSTTQGDHVLTISEDENTLRGTYKDNAGNTGPLVFKRVYPAKKE